MNKHICVEGHQGNGVSEQKGPLSVFHPSLCQH